MYNAIWSKESIDWGAGYYQDTLYWMGWGIDKNINNQAGKYAFVQIEFDANVNIYKPFLGVDFLFCSFLIGRF